jgi:hypothetical protein
LRISLVDGALGKELEIPYPYDLDDGDHNDKAEVNDRIEQFTDALLQVLARTRESQ